LFLSILEDIVVSQAAIKILLVEDNEIVRLAQVLTLQQFPSLDFCDYAADGLTAVRKAQDIKPQVILMDIGLPGIDGIEATARIKAVQPECQIVIITTQTSDSTIFDALAAGADAFCHKDITGEQLVNVIHLVANGAVWLDPRVAERVLRHCLVDSTSVDSTSRFNFGVDQKFVISPLENEALAYMSQGVSLGHSLGSTIEKGQHLLKKEMLAQAQMLRKLFSRMVKRSKSICDC
jgi:DNA-binding NarL/FixJ family response regulator